MKSWRNKDINVDTYNSSISKLFAPKSGLRKKSPIIILNEITLNVSSSASPAPDENKLKISSSTQPYIRGGAETPETYQCSQTTKETIRKELKKSLFINKHFKTTNFLSETKKEEGPNIACNINLNPKQKKTVSISPAINFSSEQKRNSISLSHNSKEKIIPKQEEDEVELLRNRGYYKIDELTKTLQGKIFKCIFNPNNKYAKKNLNSSNCNLLNNFKQTKSLNKNLIYVVIKITNKELHHKGIIKFNGNAIHVKENILLEKQINMTIQKHINQNNLIMKEFIPVLDFFENSENYYLIHKFGGTELLQWIVLNHRRIVLGQLSLEIWLNHIRILFTQVVKYMSYLHDTLNIAHLDLSLENLLVETEDFSTQTKIFSKNSSTYNNSKNSDLESHSKISNPTHFENMLLHCQIKVCDYGLSEQFKNSQDMKHCNKFVGKIKYRPPEVNYKNSPFDSRKADSWSLAVILFCCLFGVSPFEKACDSDNNFCFIFKNKKLKDLLQHYGKLKYVNESSLDLFNNLFVPEAQRLTPTQILQHPYCKNIINKIY